MKYIDDYIKFSGYREAVIDGTLKRVMQFEYDLNVYKNAFDDYYENLIYTELVTNQLNQPVLKGYITIRIAARKLHFYMFETGTFVIVRPNEKRSLYESKSPKQLISIMNAILRKIK